MKYITRYKFCSVFFMSANHFRCFGVQAQRRTILNCRPSGSLLQPKKRPSAGRCREGRKFLPNDSGVYVVLL